MSVREVYRKNWSYLTSIDLVEQGLAILDTHGWIKKITRTSLPSGGASSDLIRINPKIRST
jgi:hypothetical protein